MGIIETTGSKKPGISISISFNTNKWYNFKISVKQDFAFFASDISHAYTHIHNLQMVQCLGQRESKSRPPEDTPHSLLISAEWLRDFFPVPCFESSVPSLGKFITSVKYSNEDVQECSFSKRETVYRRFSVASCFDVSRSVY